jgi:hypothetical protein
MQMAFSALPRWNRWFLGSLLFVLVTLPLLIIGLFCCERLAAGIFGYASHDYLFVPMFWSAFYWFRVPGHLFGEPFFEVGAMGAYPRAASGWLLTVFFYVIVSLALWSVTFLFPWSHAVRNHRYA